MKHKVQTPDYKSHHCVNIMSQMVAQLQSVRASQRNYNIIDVEKFISEAENHWIFFKPHTNFSGKHKSLNYLISLCMVEAKKTWNKIKLKGAS